MAVKNRQVPERFLRNVAIRGMEVAVRRLLVDRSLWIVVLLDRSEGIARSDAEGPDATERCVRRNARISPPRNPLRMAMARVHAWMTAGRPTWSWHAGSWCTGSWHARSWHWAWPHTLHLPSTHWPSTLRHPSIRGATIWEAAGGYLSPGAGSGQSPGAEADAACGHLGQLRAPCAVGDSEWPVGVSPFSVGPYLRAPLFSDVVVIGIESNLQTASSVCVSAAYKVSTTWPLWLDGLSILIHPLPRSIMRIRRREGRPIDRGRCRGMCDFFRTAVWVGVGVLRPSFGSDGAESSKSAESAEHGQSDARSMGGSKDREETKLWVRLDVAHSSQAN